MIKSLKYLFITLCTALSMGSPGFAAGTLPLAMAQQIDINGQPLAGCQLSFFVAGTVAAPQNNYADFGLTQAQSNPLACDQSGRIPMFWLADGLIHIRLTDASGTPVIDTTMQVLGPSSGGGGGGGTVDPTSVIATGDIKARYGTGPLSGFIRCNGLTLGNAVSGATERANADTQNLFVYLYTVDTSLPVSGGRTGNALTDFNANKTIVIPDWRGNAIGALADMGNTATSFLTATYFGGDPTVLGARGGSQSHTNTVAEMASHSHSVNDPGHFHVINGGASFTAGVSSVGNGPSSPGAPGPAVVISPNTDTRTTGITLSAQGSGAPFATVTPMKLATIYMKL